MTVAVVDRLVHHATIFEMNVESYRRRTALERKRGRGRPPVHATITTNASSPRRDNQTLDRPLRDRYAATIMAVPRRRIPILIVAVLPSRSPRYSISPKLVSVMLV